MALGLLLAAAPLSAHRPPPPLRREIVRIQGYVKPPAVGVRVERLAIEILGKRLAFYATAVQRFGMTNLPGKPPAPLPEVLVLQGTPELLSRVRGAAPGQRVTLLGEHHPGRRDLFLLAVDRCPE